jgi:triacylglycerol esterase/lipase EstA (alpha/beta hydrolase family)
MCKLARALRLVLAVELALYAALAVWVGLTAGWAQALAAVLAAALVLRAGPILLSYVIAYLHASPMPRDGRIGPLRLLGALLTEIGVAVLLFAVLMPFQRNPRTTPSGGGRPPIVLVHAYLCSAGSWGSMRRRLAGRGYDVFAVDLDPFWDIDRYAPVLARHVDEVRARTGAGKVVLIGHSMGGLAIRAYLRAHGPQHVERVITLGSPHHGSVHARLAPGECGRQMRPGSPWLRALETGERGAFPVPFTSIYSRHDNFVAPQESGRLPGASNIVLTGVGHLTLLFSRRAYEAVSQALAERRSRSESPASAG